MAAVLIPLSEQQLEVLEDLALSKMMEEADIEDLVLKEDIMQKLDR